MRRALVLITAAAAIAGLLSASSAGAAVTTSGSWISRINTYRAANGRTRLAEDAQATLVAQRWTTTMASTRTLVHNPAYKVQVTTPWYRIGENIGAGGSDAALFNAFTASPGHRANMLRPEFNRVGTGRAVAANGRVWVTHIFIATTLPTATPAA